MKWIAFGLCLLLIFYVAVNVGLGIMKRYPWSDMDWNENGMVGLTEVMRAKDIGMRMSEDDCREYFAYKDGQPIKKVCTSE